jgi:hypothetical protein
MELKDTLLVVGGVLGWAWGVFQYFLNRRNQQRDKAIEKRFEVYSAFMKKMDEIMQNIRQDPKMFYGVTNDFMKKLLDGNQADIHKALLEFNNDLIDFTRRSVQPMAILNQELNNLKLVCSDELLPKIDEYKMLSNDFVNELQVVLNKVSIQQDINSTAKELEILSHSTRMGKMTLLYRDIEKVMRKEIGYYNKN